MIIKDTCSCGSEFSVQADYVHEARDTWEDWLEKHKPCREVKQLPVLGPDGLEDFFGKELAPKEMEGAEDD